MGVLANSVKDQSLTLLRETVTQNLTSNLDLGSKMCPVVSEARGLAEGIASGDRMMSALNGVLLAAYALPVGTVLPTNVKVTMASAQAGLGASVAKGAIAGGLFNMASTSSSITTPI